MPDDDGSDDPGERLADDLRVAARLLVVVALLLATIGEAAELRALLRLADLQVAECAAVLGEAVELRAAIAERVAAFSP